MNSNDASWYNPDWKYRRGVVIDRAKVSGGDLADFPVLIALTDPALKNASEGGRVVGVSGEDLLVTGADGRTKLDHEVETYDPSLGLLRAWVRVPRLSGVTDTLLYLYYGNPDCDPQQNGPGVYDAGYRLVLHDGNHDAARDATGGGNHGQVHETPHRHVTVPASRRLDATGQITVEAWVEPRRARAEALQSVVSKWRPTEGFDAFDACDAGRTDGLDTTGFFGAAFDGRYVYFVPQHDLHNRHGKVLRYDTHGAFRSPESWAGYDAGRTDGLNTKGYYGAVFDGRYVHFVPRRDEHGFHARALRYDTRGAFTDGASWEAHDTGLPNSYQSAAFDGRYIYYSPGQVAVPKAGRASGGGSPAVTGLPPDMELRSSGLILRHDTRGGFKDRTSWTTYDAAGTAGLNTTDFDGAVFDGRYVYFVPLSFGAVLRHDTQGAFDDPKSWSAYDARPLGMRRCVGAVFDGRHIYFVPYGTSEAAIRYDTEGAFADGASWEAHNILNTSGLPTQGYDGGMFDGRYIYYVPYWDEKDLFHGHVLRYDTQGAFDAPESWAACDAGDTDGLRTAGFNAGASDGRFLYFAAWHDGSAHPGGLRGNGKILRYDTTGADASFSLRFADFGHNGGLCAAIPGARFIVNTDRGALSVSADRPPEPGRRHLAGVYDGVTISLFIDGVPVNRRTGSGVILTSGVDVTIGRIQDGLGFFDGVISEVRISGVARGDGWIKTCYDNQRAPSDFVRLTAEETGSGTPS